jgi:hypothetical protein
MLRKPERHDSAPAASLALPGKSLSLLIDTGHDENRFTF